MDERGSVVPLVAAVLGIAVLSLLALVRLGELALRRAEAQTAADMAALAGLYEGEVGAADLARRNGAVLVSFRSDDDDRIEVVVRVDGVRAEASARLDWDDLSG